MRSSEQSQEAVWCGGSRGDQALTGVVAFKLKQAMA